MMLPDLFTSPVKVYSVDKAFFELLCAAPSEITLQVCSGSTAVSVGLDLPVLLVGKHESPEAEHRLVSKHSLHCPFLSQETS